jgi:two-component system, NtrC family, response regulator AtoC
VTPTEDAPTFDPTVRGGKHTVVVIAPGSFFARELGVALVIGRGLDCDVRLDDPTVSRRHAVIMAKPALALVVESKTGKTRVDGREVVGSIPLTPGQVIEIGQARIVVRNEAAPSTDSTARAIDLAARSDLPVLILGESGSGKEKTMERIVAGGKRKDAPLVRLKCEAFDLSVFDRAQSGTVFLDEVADLPLAMQPKVLRIIEDPVNARVNVRVIAATSQDLRARVAAGAFREDLYFRLAGVVVTVPPLRDRPDEIPTIARAILDEECARAGSPKLIMSDAALGLLVAYRWPGNARELRSVLARAVHLADRTIEAEHLELLPPAPVMPPPPSASAMTIPPPTSNASDNDEKARIIDALAKANGNQKEAARLLGLSRRQLMYRLDTYGLPRPRKR